MTAPLAWIDIALWAALAAAIWLAPTSPKEQEQVG